MVCLKVAPQAHLKRRTVNALNKTHSRHSQKRCHPEAKPKDLRFQRFQLQHKSACPTSRVWDVGQRGRRAEVDSLNPERPFGRLFPPRKKPTETVPGTRHQLDFCSNPPPVEAWGFSPTKKSASRRPLGLGSSNGSSAIKPQTPATHPGVDFPCHTSTICTIISGTYLKDPGRA